MRATSLPRPSWLIPFLFASTLMSFRKRKRRFERPLTDEFEPDDGLNPREWSKSDGSTIRNRKALQLCRQIERTLHLSLAGLGDPHLRDLSVQQVRPFPDSTRLLVVVASASGTSLHAAAVRGGLARAMGRLRHEVAAAIHRRKMPDLIFHIDESGLI
jgi:ribosome-binding factor A